MHRHHRHSMVDAPISRVRLRGLARLGRFQACSARRAGSTSLSASCAERLTDATSIAEVLGPRPRASPLPGTDDLVASTVWGTVSGSAAVPDVLAARIESRLPTARALIGRLYGAEHDVGSLLDRLLGIVAEASAARSDDLRALDERREPVPDWFRSERLVGYVCYVDRFADTLAGVAERLDYLQELGVGYLHLMPLLEPRPGPNDGGYAVADYRAVDPRLGDMDGLERLATELRGRGMSLCLDLVVNHTAPEHPWAGTRPRRRRDISRLLPDFPRPRRWPDAYEVTLPRGLPRLGPGNFTYNERVRLWVWTTFHEYQWDLNYTNPDVLVEISRWSSFSPTGGSRFCGWTRCPFLWKQLGTEQGEPLEALCSCRRCGPVRWRRRRRSSRPRRSWRRQN